MTDLDSEDELGVALTRVVLAYAVALVAGMGVVWYMLA